MGQLQLNRVTKTFGKAEVIKGVDLTVDEGEFCVFVGPSGCGKSTLLRMIAGLEDVSSGDVMLDGARINDLAPARREIAMVFQSYALYPHLNVRDNMGLALKQAGVPAAEVVRATDKAARMLSLGPHQVEAMTLADKIVVLRDGRVEQVGAPMTLYNDPDNMLVAGFIGSPQMNFLRGGPLGFGADTVGVRPEHLEIVADGPIAGLISHVENLGGETLVYVASEGQGLLCLRRFGQHHYAVGAAVRLGFAPQHALHFDADGRRMRRP